MNPSTLALATAQEFANALAPGQPGCCPDCLLAFAISLEGKEVTVALLGAECHEFWDACVAAVARPLTKRARDTLRTRMRRNRAACGRSSQHPATACEDAAYAFIDAACQALFSGLNYISNRAFQHKKSFGNQRGPSIWPRAPDALFPAGADESVQALLAWCTTVGPHSDYPLMVLCQYLIVARERVWAALATSAAARHRLVDVLARTLRSGMMTAPRIKGVPTAVLFLDVLATGPGARPDDALQLTLDEPRTLFTALCEAIYEDSPSSDMFPTLGTYALGLQARLGAPDKLLPASVLARRTASPDFADIMHVFLGELSRTRTCARPGCQAVSGGGSGPFKACSRCAVVRYCGDDCQRADWEGQDARFPHKRVCALLAKIAAVTRADASQREFAQALIHAGLQDGDPHHLFLFAFGHKCTPLELNMRMKDIVSLPLVSVKFPGSDVDR